MSRVLCGPWTIWNITRREIQRGTTNGRGKQALGFIRTSVTLTLHEAFFMFTLAPLGHAPPYGADNDHKKSAAFSCAIPPSSLIFPTIPYCSLLFPAIPYCIAPCRERLPQTIPIST